MKDKEIYIAQIGIFQDTLTFRFNITNTLHPFSLAKCNYTELVLCLVIVNLLAILNLYKEITKAKLVD
jgi:hypothetical protein